MKNNTIRDGRTVVYGFTVRTWYIQGNTVSGHKLANIIIEGEGNPTVKNNKIRDGLAGGVFVWLGKVSVRSMEMRSMAIKSLVFSITSDGNPTVKNNIRDGLASGIYVYEKGLGIIDGNEIYGNKKLGISIKTGGKSNSEEQQDLRWLGRWSICI